MKKKKEKLKNLSELKEGRCIIVTDQGEIPSYNGAGLPIFLMVPNKAKILGFKQSEEDTKPRDFTDPKTKNIKIYKD